MHSFVLPPQASSYDQIDRVLKRLPSHPVLEDLRCIGWIHTTALDDPLMTPSDAITSTLFCDVNSDLLDQFQFADIVVSFTPGSCTIRGFQLNPDGMKWGSDNSETRDRPVGFEDSFFTQLPVVIAESYSGWFMVPVGVEWNMNFQGLKLDDMDSYDVELGHPAPFYDQRHRPNHFLQFATDMEATASIDYEDNFC